MWSQLRSTKLQWSIPFLDLHSAFAPIFFHGKYGMNMASTTIWCHLWQHPRNSAGPSAAIGTSSPPLSLQPGASAAPGSGSRCCRRLSHPYNASLRKELGVPKSRSNHGQNSMGNHPTTCCFEWENMRKIIEGIGDFPADFPPSHVWWKFWWPANRPLVYIYISHFTTLLVCELIACYP